MEIRRSLTISEENDIGIQHAMSELLQKDPPEDIDYTKMVNRLIKIGLKKGVNHENNQKM